VLRRGAAFVAVRPDGAILVRTRPPKGLLGGMTEVPGTAWAAGFDAAAALGDAPVAARWTKVPGTVGHVFTHFPLELVVFRAQTQAEAPAGCRWLPKREIPGAAFPTVFRKVLAHALEDAD
jgi:A/G-specific adenine glycosylase